MVQGDVGQAVIEKRIGQPLQCPPREGLGSFGPILDRRDNLLEQERFEPGANPRVVERFADRFDSQGQRFGDQRCMGPVQDADFPQVIWLQLLDELDGRVGRYREAAGGGRAARLGCVAFDQPEREGLGDGQQRVLRRQRVVRPGRGDDPVDERVAPDAFVANPLDPIAADRPARGLLEHQVEKLIGISLDEFTGEDCQSVATRLESRQENGQQFGRKRFRRPAGRRFRGRQRQSGFGRVGDDRHQRLGSSRLENLVPILGGGKGPADACHLAGAVHDLAGLQTSDRGMESAVLPVDLPGSLRSGRLDRDDLTGRAGALVQFLGE